ncbi:MAG: hypothetical protein WCR45_01290 [Bacteroidaceae bacterium]|nr:hypothetical protein [Bacteroidaceae bacterium]
MKVIIPISKNKCIADGFNTTADVCVFDTETEATTFTFWKEIIPSGSSILAQFEKMKIAGAIVGHIQLMALKVLSEKGFVVYKSQGRILQQNLMLLKENKLTLYPPIEAMENGVICSGECNSCTNENIKK